MYPAKKTLKKTGETVWYIRQAIRTNSGETKRIYIVDDDKKAWRFSTLELARKFIQSQKAAEDYRKTREELVQKFYFEFQDLESYVGLVEKRQSIKAKNTPKRVTFDLHNYVFVYFLNIKKLNNIQSWSLYFDDFIEWLSTAKTIRKKKGEQLLSAATQNHIINALNVFLMIVWKKQKPSEAPPKCERIEDSNVKRGAADLMPEREFKLFYEELGKMAQESDKKEIILKSRDLIAILYGTGMRLNECLSLAVGDFFNIPINEKNLQRQLQSYGLDSLSHLIFNSQLAENSSKIPNQIVRKSLKGRKYMDEASNRIVPIMDNLTHETLKNVTRETIRENRLAELKEFPRGQYLLFPDLTKAIVSGHLSTAFRRLKQKGLVNRWKCLHCLRHTYSTELVKRTYNQTLVNLILGHKSRAYEAYCHLISSTASDLLANSSAALIMD